MLAGTDFLVSFGDCLEPGTYSFHSAFERAVNYVRGERLLSFVTAEVGGGPANIVLRDLRAAQADAIRITPTHADLGDWRVFLASGKMYRSALSFDLVRRVSILSNLNLFARMVIEHSPPLSFAFLLEPRRAVNFTSPLQRHLAHRVLAGWECLRRLRIAEGLSLIQGVGWGLTPAGDDFIAGWAAGLHLAQTLAPTGIMGELEIIAGRARSENPIARSFMHYAVQGRFGEKIKDLLQALPGGTEADVRRHALEVLSIGQTSGADFCAGVIASLQCHGIFPVVREAAAAVESDGSV